MEIDEKRIVEQWRIVLKEFLNPFDMMRSFPAVFEIGKEHYIRVCTKLDQPHLAVDDVINVILKSSIGFKDFISAMKQSGCDWVAKLISGDVKDGDVEKAVHQTDNQFMVRRILTVLSPRLEDIVRAEEVARSLLLKNILNQEEQQHIEAELRQRGNIHAVRKMLMILVRKPPGWWIHFTEIVKDLRYEHELVDSLEALFTEPVRHLSRVVVEDREDICEDASKNVAVHPASSDVFAKSGSVTEINLRDVSANHLYFVSPGPSNVAQHERKHQSDKSQPEQTHDEALSGAASLSFRGNDNKKESERFIVKCRECKIEICRGHQIVRHQTNHTCVAKNLKKRYYKCIVEDGGKEVKYGMFCNKCNSQLGIFARFKQATIPQLRVQSLEFVNTFSGDTIMGKKWQDIPIVFQEVEMTVLENLVNCEKDPISFGVNEKKKKRKIFLVKCKSCKIDLCRANEIVRLETNHICMTEDFRSRYCKRVVEDGGTETKYGLFCKKCDSQLGIFARFKQTTIPQLRVQSLEFVNTSSVNTIMGKRWQDIPIVFREVEMMEVLANLVHCEEDPISAVQHDKKYLPKLSNEYFSEQVHEEVLSADTKHSLVAIHDKNVKRFIATCKNCKRKLCIGNEIVRLGTNHTCLTEDFKSRYHKCEVEDGGSEKKYGMFCNNCKSQLGIFARFRQTTIPQLRVQSLEFVDISSTHTEPVTKKQWSDVPITFEEVSYEKLMENL